MNVATKWWGWGIGRIGIHRGWNHIIYYNPSIHL